MTRGERPRPRRPPSLRDQYIHWLESELTSEAGHGDRTYFELVNVMFNTEFVWSPELPWCIPMDDNRIADGMELRWEFAERFNAPRESMANMAAPSFIEVLLGLSRRLSFVAGGTPGRWAWQLLVNLGLERMWDHLSRSKTLTVQDILQTVIHRSYKPNGDGGFFPLAWHDRDQRQVELWYQLNAYAEELHPEH